MLRDKGTKKIEEIKTDFTPSSLQIEKMMNSFKAMKVAESFSAFKQMKKRGYGFKELLSLLIWIVTLREKTVYSSLPDLYGYGIKIGKDALYRLKNNENICWRRLLWHIGMKFIKVTESGSTIEEKKAHYLIFDDTAIEKSGKKMEFLGRVWDHVKQRSILGFKILVMCYWDGVSCIPLDFSIHREKGKRENRPYGMSKKELSRQYGKKRGKESESGKRVKELEKSKIEMMLKMFYSALYRCLRIDYVLVDSWFTCEALIKAVISQSVHLTGMYKIAQTKFEYRGKRLTYSEINKGISKVKRCRSLKLQYKLAEVVYSGIKLTLFFSRQGKRGEWKVFLTTDMNLSFVKLIEHYQVRWSIEVFFKETKGILNLGGCQSSDFDAQIADTTISMIAYILLSFRYRYDHYESMGALYRSMNAERLRLTLDKRLWELFLEIIRVIADMFETDVDALMEKLLTNPEMEQFLEQMLGDRFKDAC
jgi:hypothetical protein